VTTDLSVKATDKSVERTVFGRLEQKPNFTVAQQNLFFGAIFGHQWTINRHSWMNNFSHRSISSLVDNTIFELSLIAPSIVTFLKLYRMMQSPNPTPLTFDTYLPFYFPPPINQKFDRTVKSTVS
jgi:hypothetical protein